MTRPKSQAGPAFQRVTGISQTIFFRQLVQDPVLFKALLQAGLTAGENAARTVRSRYAVLRPGVAFSPHRSLFRLLVMARLMVILYPIWEIEDCAEAGTRLYQRSSILLNSERARLQWVNCRGLMTNESRDGANTLLLREYRLLPTPGPGWKRWV